MLLSAGAQILSGDVDNTVGIDVEGDLDLRHAAAGRSNAVQMEAAQRLVAGSHLTLALQDVDLHGGLIISGGGEDLALLHRDGGVALNEAGADAAHGLDTEGQGGDVQQQEALHIAGENAGLQSGTQCHALVGVDALEGLVAGEGLDSVHNGGDTAGAANHQHLGKIRGLEAGIGHSLTDGAHGGLHQMTGKLVELSAGQGHIQVLGAGSVGGDIGQVDIAAHDAGQLDLSLLSGFLQTLHGNLIAAEVHALALLELGNQILHDALVEVVAAEAVVTGSGQHLDDAVINLQNGHVERTAAQIVDHDLLSLLLIHTVGKSCCGGLVDDTLHLEAGDLTGVLGGLTLSVGEVSGNGDDSLGDGSAQIALGVSLQLLQHHGADLLRSVGLAIHIHLVVRTHLTLNGSDGAIGVGDSLTLCHLAHHTLAGLGKCHHGGGRAVTLSVGDNDSLAAFHNGYAGVGRTQINTDNFRHMFCPPKRLYQLFQFVLNYFCVSNDTKITLFLVLEAKPILIIFCRDMCVAKNTSRSAQCARFARARSRVQFE